MLSKEKLNLGQLLHKATLSEYRLIVITDLYDEFMIIEYKLNGIRLKETVYYTAATCFFPIFKNGEPVIAKKNLFRRYILKLY